MSNSQTLDGPPVPTTTLLPRGLRRTVERLAAQEKRSLSQFLALLIAAGVARRAGRAGRAQATATGGAEHASTPA